MLRKIWGSDRAVAVKASILGCYVVLTLKQLPMFRRIQCLRNVGNFFTVIHDVISQKI